MVLTYILGKEHKLNLTTKLLKKMRFKINYDKKKN